MLPAMNKLLLWVGIIFLPVLTYSQDTSSKDLGILLKNSVFFNSPDPVEMTIVSDFKRLRSKRQKKVYQPATVTLTLPGQAPIKEEIQLAARGVMRRSICAAPPIVLNFKNPKAPLLSKLKKMKLVNGCSQSDFDEELVLKEYLIYKMYNMLTDLSFGVRLAKLTYNDVEGKIKPYTQYGFLIEDIDDLAKRNKSREYEKPVLSGARLDRTQMTLVSMFQYMIGNTDWSFPNRHNIRFVQSVSDTLSYPYLVPYDFDYSGMVDAPYAVPQPDFGIEKVTDRYYRGMARAKQEVDPIVQLFKEKREFFTALIKNFTPLPQKQRDGMLRYLEDFYKDLNDQRKLTYVFEKAVDHF
jgi:hypothetical protein